MRTVIGCLLLSALANAAEPKIIPVWQAKAPGETKELPPEQNITKPSDPPVGDRPIIKLTNVSTPTLAIYSAPEKQNTRVAVIVCPGGGHRILAYDHEGTEVAEWLNTLGVTAIVLKYRVPTRDENKRWLAAVQDAQRAISVVRNQAADLSIDSNRIGILGFSAGGEVAALAATMHDQRQYSPVDKTDEVSARPDFAVLIYPGGLLKKDQALLQDHIQVTKQVPPMFFAHAFDDRVDVMNSILLASELKKAGVSAELHLYATGGHGFGMRQTGHPCNHWPERCAEWLRATGVVK